MEVGIAAIGGLMGDVDALAARAKAPPGPLPELEKGTNGGLSAWT